MLFYDNQQRFDENKCLVCQLTQEHRQEASAFKLTTYGKMMYPQMTRTVPDVKVAVVESEFIQHLLRRRRRLKV